MNGFYNVIKPLGESSSRLVVRLKKLLREKLGKKVKVGHLGTLDPMATGVLGIAVGSATKLFDYFLAKTKKYVATCVLGVTTDTLDSAGTVTETKPYEGVSDAEFEAALAEFVGKISQIPPAYSAKSVGGVRAYRLAAKGIAAELKPCEITVYSIRLLEKKGDNEFLIEVECSGGTYIRSLCRDIGAALGYPAYMGSLERVRNGTMRIEDAVTIESVEEDLTRGFTSLERFGESLTRLDYTEADRKKLDNGVKMETDREDGYVTVYVADAFYGIGRTEGGYLSLIARENAIG